jgi:hypothetical protein
MGNSNMDLRDIVCDDGRRLELVQVHVQWWA